MILATSSIPLPDDFLVSFFPVVRNFRTTASDEFFRRLHFTFTRKLKRRHRDIFKVLRLCTGSGILCPKVCRFVHSEIKLDFMLICELVLLNLHITSNKVQEDE